MISNQLRSVSIHAIVLLTFVFAAGHAYCGRKGKKQKTDISSQLRKKYKKIVAVKLLPWEHEDSVVITEKDAKSYKVVRPDKNVEYLDKIPKKADGIEKLYVRKNPPGFAYVITDKGRQYVWVRLYWNPTQEKWLTSHPNSSIFIKEKIQVRDFLSCLNKHFDRNAAYRIPVIVSQLRNPRLKDDLRKKYESELHELTKKIGKSWEGTSLLDSIYDINIKIHTASIEDKIKLAKKRRKLLKKIAKKIESKSALDNK